MSRALVILDTEFQRRKAADWCWSLKHGTRVEFKAPKRSDDQNALFWVLLTKVATTLKWHGHKLTADDWKLQFLDALRRSKQEELRIVPNIDNTGFVNLSNSSSDLSKDEMSELIELILAFGAKHDVQFDSTPADPVDGAGHGSGDETPSQATASDQSGAPSPDPAGDDDNSDPVQSEEVASSPAPTLSRMLMEEAIDGMLNATDLASLDRIYDAFLLPDNLGPDHKPFLDRCYDTVKRVFDQPKEHPRAREYLLGKIPA